MPLITGVDDNDIQKFEITDSIVSDNQVVGSFNLNLATIKLINPNKKYSNLKGQWIDTLMGKLYVYEAPETQGDVTIELKCYDSAYKFDQAYEDVAIFPTTVGNWLEAICQNVGVELATTKFTNSDLILDSKPYLSEDASFRDAVREIAGAAGCFAQIIDNKLYIKWFEDTTAEIPDWFELTQEDQVAPVNITVLGRGDLEDNIIYPTEIPDEPHELRIDDNQILLQRERETIEAIYNQVVGFSYRVFNLRFIGLKNVRAGQRIKYKDIDGDSVTTPIMTNELSFCGGNYNDLNAWESKISSVHLNETNTNYKYAGSIMKSLKQTEALVDKTNQRIELIVAEQRTLGEQVEENFTKVTQTLTEVRTNVQNSGGSNLIKNSAMFLRGSDGSYTSWDIGEPGTLEAVPSAEAVTYGSLSGQVIKMAGKTIRQVISVKANHSGISEDERTYYSFSCRVRKGAAGNALIKLTDGQNVWQIEVSNNSAPLYKEFVVDGMLPNSTEMTLEVTASSDADFAITDMMLTVGNMHSAWTQASGELANTTVQIDIDGITVRSESTDNLSNEITPQGVVIRKNNKVVASVAHDGMMADKVEAASAIKMPPIQIIAQDDGWAFVGTE